MEFKYFTDSVGILLPTKARYEILSDSLYSLSETKGAKDLLDVIILADQDTESYKIAIAFPEKQKFRTYRVIYSATRLYPVKAFISLYEVCSSRYFCVMNDENIYESDWLTRALDRFDHEFPDKIGLLSFLKISKAGLCLTTQDFVCYNENEFFNPVYKLYYSDDELTIRAILLGRYAWQKHSGVIHDSEITKAVSAISWEEKLTLKKIDRDIFRKRLEVKDFGLPEEKVYKWEGFREVSLPLRVRI